MTLARWIIVARVALLAARLCAKACFNLASMPAKFDLGEGDAIQATVRISFVEPVSAAGDQAFRPVRALTPLLGSAS